MTFEVPISFKALNAVPNAAPVIPPRAAIRGLISIKPASATGADICSE